MNKYKFIIHTNLLWHISLSFLSLPLIANIFGFLPILCYSIILSYFIKVSDSYIKLLFKALSVFLILAAFCSIEPTLFVGIVMSMFAILMALIINPFLIKYCKE